jgi:H+/Cl- antiporter ClcA
MKLEITLNTIDLAMIGLLIVVAVFFGIVGVAVWALVYGCYLFAKGCLRTNEERRGFVKTDFLLIAIFIAILIISIIAYMAYRP